VSEIPYKSPVYLSTAFNCPLCNAYADQLWFETEYKGTTNTVSGINICFCNHCKKISIWYLGKMVYPDFSGVEMPNKDLPDEIKNDYMEAANILQKSPRGSAALLRLVVQKLCIHLGENKKDLNDSIKNLVKKGLSPIIQKSLDSLRVIGNEAVHPGQMDLKDDVKTASSLFKLINKIADVMITDIKEIDEIFGKIPDSKKEQIIKRDQ
jgi:hypothetical protein